MCNLNEWIVREAVLAYHRGDVAAMMNFVDPGLEWTYLDPGPGNPQPQICHGRGELEKALRRQAALGLRAELRRSSPPEIKYAWRCERQASMSTGNGGPTTGHITLSRCGMD